MKRRLFNIAWTVRKSFTTFSEALVYAWKVIKLQIALCLGVVTFQYKKIDGSIRTAVGTRDNVPAIKGTGKPNHTVLTYFDVEVAGWRSCQLQSLIF